MEVSKNCQKKVDGHKERLSRGKGDPNDKREQFKVLI